MSKDLSRKAPLKPGEYRCELCRCVFENETEGWGEEQAMDEAKKFYGSDVEKDTLSVICDDCYMMLVPQPPVCAECKCELDGPVEGETLIEAANIVLLCPDCHGKLTEHPPVDFFDWIKMRVEPVEREERII